ncbi:hypothetical protein Cgig2_003385 [Carnegiea gigantea]|uniref:Uncharacterized protein n=1 Tax=Carnegiea gigantea TaxID=171969 RepID=A0A9Q1JQ12_9CARY|nr:hypothetical protein Cgig2_003385 [Carnegiea gigantea]
MEQNLDRVLPTFASMVDPTEGTTLEFIPVSMINGTKCAKVVGEDIEGEVIYWQNAVICCVLGANQPYEFIAGYVRRIWSEFAIDKVLLIRRGLLVEMPLEGYFPDSIEFANEKSVLIRQKVIYEWLPLKCSHCKMFGQTQENYRKQDIHRKEWRVKSQVLPQEQNQPSERVESRGYDVLQLVTKHTIRHSIIRAEGQKEITTPNDLLQANTYNVLLEEDENQAEDGEGGS